MKMFIVLIAVAGLATGCVTYSDRGEPGYAEGTDRGTSAYYREDIDLRAPVYPEDINLRAREYPEYPGSIIHPHPSPTWPEVEVGTESGNMRRDRFIW
jgi:hypothetical protein